MILAHYKLNDNAASTTVLDDIGAYNGTYNDGGGAINTSTGASTGKVEGALSFDGDEWVDIGAGPSTVKSVSIWVNQADVAGLEWLLDLQGVDLILTNAGVVTVNGFATAVLYIDGAVAVSGTSTITANWHHIVATASGAKNASDFDIGHVGGNYMEGLIDNVMLFDITLNIDQVKSLYSAGHGTEIAADVDESRRIKRRPIWQP